VKRRRKNFIDLAKQAHSDRKRKRIYIYHMNLLA